MRNRYRGLMLLTLLALGLGLAGGHFNLAAEEPSGPAPLAPEPAHVQKARLIGDLLSAHHYRRQVIDDALSKTVFEAYLRSLDRDRYFFLAEDIESFHRYRDQLDNSFRTGDMTGAFRIFHRYQQRVQERVEYAKALLQKDLQFKDDDVIELDRSKAPWAANRAELDELWRKRVMHDAITLRLADQDWDKVKEVLTARYERIGRVTNQYTADDVFEIYMNAWAQTFDPHTAYMSPRQSENFDIHMRLSLEGIGAVLRSENDMTEVVELVTGGPAALSGQLHPGDRILGVGQGETGEMVDVVGWRLEDVVDLIRGPKESVVRLQVLPATGDTAPQIIKLVRNEIQLEAQAAQAKRIEVGSGPDKQRIGVITVPVFYMDFHAADAGDRNYRSTTRDVRRLIEQLEREGIDGLIIDLRGNGGGSLREATDMTGLFLPGAPVVQVRRSDGEIEVLRDNGANEGVAYKGPLAVLVDGFSASASEIFAAAIQDHGRGVVIGQQTFGKGTVQNLIDLDHFGLQRNRTPMGRLKLTIAQFYRVSGGSTQQLGVEPDIPLPSPVDAQEFGETSVPNALRWGSIKPLAYRRDPLIDELLPQLRKRHEERAATNPAFKALAEEYAYLRSLQQQRTVVPLTESARRAERERLQAEQLKYLNRRRAAYGLEPLAKLDEERKLDDMPDTLLESAAAIVADLRMLSAAHKSLDQRLQARHSDD